MTLSTQPTPLQTIPIADGLQQQDASLSLSELAYQSIRKMILRGEIKPGAKLKIEQLQNMTGFSSSPLRESLSRLSEEGLVQTQSNRGFRAAPLTLTDLRDIYTLRQVLECAALEASITHGDHRWEGLVVAAFHRLEFIESRLEKQSPALSDPWTQAHSEFHLALYSACGSQRQLSLTSQLFDQAERYRRLSALHRTQPRHKSADHKNLMKLALARQNIAAKDALFQHMAVTMVNLENVLSEVVAAWR